MMETHHVVWLSVHPERSVEWLKERLADGFHVHHVDGYHENNNPVNLVLIESGDHMMLHNGGGRLLWKPIGAKSHGSGRRRKPTIEELEEKLAPMIEARDRKIKREFRIKMRDLARAQYARNVVI